ncbi:MAG: glycosyltransferase family 4 protein [Candidatus Acidiferrales bacterium]
MESERNILIIVQNLPVPFDRRVWQEATSLRKAGFGVAVICPKKKIYTKSYELLEGVDIYRYPLIYEADKGVAGYFVEFVYCWIASLLLAMKAYAHRPFHAIHACNPPDTFFALAMLFRPLGVKFVFDHHDLCPEMYVAKSGRRAGLLYRAQVLLERLSLRSADMVIAVNRSHRDIALQRGGVDPSKVIMVRSGPPRAWADLSVVEPRLKGGRQYLVVYLGEMCQQDGVDRLVNAIRQYADSCPKDTLFALIGGGPDQQRMKDMVERVELNDWVRFTGRVSDEVLWQYLATADLCVDPDPYSEWSDLSTMNKIIEYLAFGKPVVAFELTEHRRSAHDAAFYVDRNDDAKLASAIRELLLDEERRGAMGQYGQLRFREHLAWENSEQELVRMYSGLLTAVKAAGVEPEPHRATD